MRKKEYEQFSEDLLLLEKLKLEQTKNLKKCMNRIDRRRRTLLLSTSIAAALIAISFLVLNPHKPNDKRPIAEQKKINTPTLILESGETIPLSDDHSELQALKEDISGAKITTHQPTEKFSTVIIPNCYTQSDIRGWDGSLFKCK